MRQDASSHEIALIDAQRKAEELFRAVADGTVIRAGALESRINEDVYALARDMFGTTTHWHKRIVRAGRNTLAPYAETPPDLVVRDDDIVFLDFGPVFGEWEADFGRTYVLGTDPAKLKLRDDAERAFAEGKAHFARHEDITASELFAFVAGLAERDGWEYGGPIAGHPSASFRTSASSATR